MPSASDLRRALARYDEAIATRGASRLPELDAWYRRELPAIVAARDPAFVTLEELVRATEWKMKRGAWRARNLVLVRGNDPDRVVAASRDAFALAPDPRKPLVALTALSGVGPATASAILAARHPDAYPFFDEEVAKGIPELGKVAFTLPYYVRYAARLREIAAEVSQTDARWTAHEAAQAMWADAVLRAR